MDPKRSKKLNTTEKQKPLLVYFVVKHSVQEKNTANSKIKDRQNLIKNISSTLNDEVELKTFCSGWKRIFVIH